MNSSENVRFRFSSFVSVIFDYSPSISPQIVFIHSSATRWCCHCLLNSIIQCYIRRVCRLINADTDVSNTTDQCSVCECERARTRIDTVFQAIDHLKWEILRWKSNYMDKTITKCYILGIKSILFGLCKAVYATPNHVQYRGALIAARPLSCQRVERNERGRCNTAHEKCTFDKQKMYISITKSFVGMWRDLGLTGRFAQAVVRNIAHFFFSFSHQFLNSVWAIFRCRAHSRVYGKPPTKFRCDEIWFRRRVHMSHHLISSAKLAASERAPGCQPISLQDQQNQFFWSGACGGTIIVCSVRTSVCVCVWVSFSRRIFPLNVRQSRLCALAQMRYCK